MTTPKLKHYIYVLGLVILIGALSFCIYAWRKGWEEMSRMGCQCNVKQILLCLHMYAEKNGGWFPNKTGDEGLQMLYAQDYLNASSTTFCPSVSSDGKSIDYNYISGYRIDSDKNIGIILDKETNHKDYGNIGFVDGRALPFYGKDWRKNANMVK